MSPAARQTLGAGDIERLTEAVGSSLHVVYMIAGLVALVSLVLAMALPARPNFDHFLTEPAEKTSYSLSRRSCNLSILVDRCVAP
jgi:hypothetical protein